LPYNSYETKGDLRTKTDINKASVTFEEIAGFETGLTTINGTPITIGDLLYMYTTLVNGGKINTSVTIMYPGMIRYSKLSFESRINQYYTNIDRLTGIASSDLVVVSPNEQNDNKSE
jgi:hypothetical protein